MIRRKRETLREEREKGKEEVKGGKGKEKLEVKKRRISSSSSSDDDFDWRPARSKKKVKKERSEARKLLRKEEEEEEKGGSSSDESSSDGDPDESVEEKAKSSAEIKKESLARQRMLEGRPKNEEEKYGDESNSNYQAFKSKFRAVTNVQGINQLDVLNEITNWLKGTPKILAESFQGAKNPKSAMKKLWKELDRFYDLNSLTAEERVKPLVVKGKIGKDDVDAHLTLMAELKAIQRAAKTDKVTEQLDRGDIVREIINAKVPFMSEEFYRREAKIKRKEQSFRMKFDDLIEAVSERAAILKAQGKTSKSAGNANSAKVAAAKTTAGHQQYNNIVKTSPPKA